MHDDIVPRTPHLCDRFDVLIFPITEKGPSGTVWQSSTSWEYFVASLGEEVDDHERVRNRISAFSYQFLMTTTFCTNGGLNFEQSSGRIYLTYPLQHLGRWTSRTGAPSWNNCYRHPPRTEGVVVAFSVLACLQCRCNACSLGRLMDLA